MTDKIAYEMSKNKNRHFNENIEGKVKLHIDIDIKKSDFSNDTTDLYIMNKYKSVSLLIKDTVIDVLKNKHNIDAQAIVLTSHKFTNDHQLIKMSCHIFCKKCML